MAEVSDNLNSEERAILEAENQLTWYSNYPFSYAIDHQYIYRRPHKEEEALERLELKNVVGWSKCRMFEDVTTWHTNLAHECSYAVDCNYAYRSNGYRPNNSYGDLESPWRDNYERLDLFAMTTGWESVPETSTRLCGYEEAGLASLLGLFDKSFLRVVGKKPYTDVAVWISDRTQTTDLTWGYLIDLLKEIQMRFEGSRAELTLILADEASPLKIFIHGIKDAGEEGDSLRAFEAHLSEEGRSPRDFGVGFISI